MTDRTNISRESRFKRLSAINKLLLSLLAGGTVWVIGLAIFHAYETYSPVPVWDMWTGYIGFYEKLSHGDWSIWWSPHTEHRIFLGRLLFWIDLYCFQGRSIFLIVMNYVMVACMAALFWRILSDQLPGMPNRAGKMVLGLVITSWLYLLCQRENLIWAFQGVFNLVFLLPLAAFYWLQRSAKSNSPAEFLVACLLGVLACGSMANGTLALPLMAVFALVTWQRPLRIVILGFVSVVFISLYFHGLAVNHNTEVLKHPFQVAQFLFGLLGSPFYYLLNREPHVAQASGCVFILAILFKAAHVIRRPRQDLLQTSLLFYLFYVCVSALGVTAGRMFLGQNMAFEPHYTTVAIVGWAVLCAVYSVSLARPSWQVGWAACSLIAVALMVRLQIGLLGAYNYFLYPKALAAFSLALGVQDSQALVKLGHPDFAPIEIPPLAEVAYAKHLSIFGLFPYRDAREQLGVPVPHGVSSTDTCVGTIDGLTTTTDSRFIRLNGWIYNPSSHREPVLVRILSESGVEVGAALTGERPELAKSLGSGSYVPGYDGYAFGYSAGKSVILQGEDSCGVICRAPGIIPPLPFSIQPFKIGSDQVTVPSSDVLSATGWTGSDFNRTNFHAFGLRVYGTYNQPIGGVISLLLKRGDRLLYRSGSLGGKQSIEIGGQPAILLPSETEWTVLSLSSPIMPIQPTVVKLSDDGNGVEEWSAIAVRDGSPSLSKTTQKQ